MVYDERLEYLKQVKFLSDKLSKMVIYDDGKFHKDFLDFINLIRIDYFKAYYQYSDHIYFFGLDEENRLKQTSYFKTHTPKPFVFPKKIKPWIPKEKIDTDHFDKICEIELLSCLKEQSCNVFFMMSTKGYKADLNEYFYHYLKEKLVDHNIHLIEHIVVDTETPKSTPQKEREWYYQGIYTCSHTDNSQTNIYKILKDVATFE